MARTLRQSRQVGAAPVAAEKRLRGDALQDLVDDDDELIHDSKKAMSSVCASPSSQHATFRSMGATTRSTWR